MNCDVDKTEAMILRTNSQSLNATIPPLLIGNEYILCVTSTKVFMLGVIIDDELKFSKHNNNNNNNKCYLNTAIKQNLYSAV